MKTLKKIMDNDFDEYEQEKRKAKLHAMGMADLDASK